MLTAVNQYCRSVTAGFDSISDERKKQLKRLSAYIAGNLKNGNPVNLVYICTHNSRRSHFGQVWSKVAAEYYEIENINTFSGGAEVTSLHPNTAATLSRAGLSIEKGTQEINPVYKIRFDEKKPAIRCFSKVYDDANNPSKGFAAIMTCSEAEANCPFIPGADVRIPVPYEDPKSSDGKASETATYDACCQLIALESLFVFSQLKPA
jgi:arsenate reductase (thioredoxin)